ncbi:hypothetical protein Salat_1730700 [Sesamum alatum]|uniref:Uncharacterized protein n=1 Tax=Sesamum alatum TaxID=300844 RepID=A0AAE1Y8M0_9LAMI|nr:hypothetical protein Salat_1730700 [Sesamum alatum]
MALMSILRPAWLSMAGVPDYDGYGREVKVYVDAVGDPKIGAETQGDNVVEDDEFDIDDGVDYLDDDEYFDDNIDKGVEWAGLLEKDQEDVQQDEVIVDEDCPPLTQPEEAVLDNKKKPVRRAIFNDEVEPAVLQVPVAPIMHFHNVNPKPLTVPTPAPPPMHPSLKIRAPPPMLGHPPSFVPKPITDPIVPHSSGPIIMKDGKIFVMLSNLNTAMQSEQHKDKGKRRKN